MKSLVTEFIGTFFLVLTIGLTVLGGSQFAPLAIGSALMVMVYMGGHISGAHYNPAVTLAVFLRGKLPAAQVVPYMLVQVVGALAAAAITRAAMGKNLIVAPAPDAAPMTAVMIEVLFTFALALVVLNTATARKTEGNSFYGLAIGFTLCVGAFAGGPISGGAFNPAVATGPILFDTLSGGSSIANLWVYLVGTFLGGALAAAVFRVQEQ